MLDNRVQKNAAYRIIAPAVWVFDIVIEPIVRSLPVVIRSPKLSTMGTMAEKGVMEWHDKNV